MDALHGAEPQPVAHTLPNLQSSIHAVTKLTPFLFMQAVQGAGSDPLFRQAQDEFADDLYFAPSQKLAKQLGFR